MARLFRLCLLGILAHTFVAGGFAADELKLPLEITALAGQRDRVEAVVEFPLPSKSAAQALRLVETSGGKESPVASQLDPQSGRLVWVAGGQTPAGSKRTYRLEAGSSVASPQVVMMDSGTALEAQFEGKPLLRYSKAHVEPAAGIDPKYGRSAHLHPIWTPGGAMVTDEFPPDHLHQSGIFFAFTRTKFEGRDVDFWNLAGGKGRVRFKELKGTASGPIFGQFHAEHEHIDLTATDDKTVLGNKPGEGKVALVESWDVRIWTAGMKSGYWLMDITSRVSCAGESPLALPEYHYGGMAIRAARPWTPEHVRFLTSEGDDRIKGNHTRPRWCDIRGAVGGKQAGITLMTHPSNFRFPEPLRIHPTMPYMVYTPQFLGAWEIRLGSPHESRYRFVIHDGEFSPEKLELIWRDYAELLVATGG